MSRRVGQQAYPQADVADGVGRSTTPSNAAKATASRWASSTVECSNFVFVVALVGFACLMLVLSIAPSVPHSPTDGSTPAPRLGRSLMHPVSPEDEAPAAVIRHTAEARANHPAQWHERYAAELYAGMVEPQRPWQDPDGRRVQLPPTAIRSVNPPGHNVASHGGAAEAELDTRLVIAIASAVHSGKLGAEIKSPDPAQIRRLPVIAVLLSSWLANLQPHHVYRFYLAFDHNDPIYSRADMRTAVHDVFAELVAEESSKRWHPPASAADSAIHTGIDASTLLVSVHWVECAYSKKPSWAHSDAVVAAYAEGADYAFRVNDDSQAPSPRDAVDRFIIDLRARTPVPNLGVVGPTCKQGAPWILTHDFTHRTHVAVFGFHYPRSLPDWSSDDFITYAYEQYGLAHKLPDVEVVHQVKFLGRRYTPSSQQKRRAALREAVLQAAVAIDTWTRSACSCTLVRSPVQVRTGRGVDITIDATEELASRAAAGIPVTLPGVDAVPAADTLDADEEAGEEHIPAPAPARDAQRAGAAVPVPPRRAGGGG